MKPSVLIALSGGVDSSVAALLLKKRGYKVTALFMKNFSPSYKSLKKALCWAEEEKWAKKIAAILDIPLIIINSEKQYKTKVIDRMIKDYKKGLTPNPDTLCNKLIKFPLLLKEAKKRNIPLIATGHYARIRKTRQSYQLEAGKDASKDQSYFLYQLSQNELSRALFPLGNLKKEEVRKIAERNHLPNFSKPSTKGICFVGNVSMMSFLKKKIPKKKGVVKCFLGKVLGTHLGTQYYTIGQRIGSHIGIDVIKPKGTEQMKWYVAGKKGNFLIVAPEGNPLLKKQKIIIKNFHQINPKEKIPSRLKARIRHLGRFLKGKLAKKNSHFIFTLSKPAEGIAEAQAIVLYHNSQVIGGGDISYHKVLDF